MTILVDDLTDYLTDLINPGARRCGRRWCHMVSDTSLDELHEFADKLGLKRAWFQKDHYDLTPGMRAKALSLGATSVGPRELAKRRVKPASRQKGEDRREDLEPPDV